MAPSLLSFLNILKTKVKFEMTVSLLDEDVKKGVRQEKSSPSA